MADISYQQARKLGLKEVKSRTARHESPYLAVLDDLIPSQHNPTLIDLGATYIDIEQIAGTRSASRREAFSASFYPLLAENSEFADKWSNLATAQLREGIRDPILVVEYLNRFYVVEGHKRVSVLRYFGATTLRAEIRRLMPVRDGSPEVEAYFEFLDFYKRTGLNYIQFDQPGKYPVLLDLLCGADTAPWDEDRKRGFIADISRFRKAFRATELPGKRTQDEAMLEYLRIFGYAHLQARTPGELKKDLVSISSELLRDEAEVEPVLMTDAQSQPRGILDQLVHPALRNLKVAFLHDKSPETSYWTSVHEKGREAVQAVLPDRVETVSRFNMLQADFDEIVRELAQAHYDVVFTTTPRLLDATLAAAAAYPAIKFLNCSINVSHPLLRCYYGRMYEAKFLTGVIAGTMCRGSSIGYVCNYPIFASAASVNAFALGARMVNPEVRILLRWSAVPDSRIEEYFAENQVTAISGLDGDPSLHAQEQGVFVLENGVRRNLAYSAWNWGNIYQRILESILDGTWSARTGSAGQSINYWWGMDSGAVDVFCCDALPSATNRLIQLLRDGIQAGQVRPFEGPIWDQSGALRVRKGEQLSPLEIVQMDWFVDNVTGSLPRFEELTPEARDLVRVQGVLKPEA